MSGFNFKVVCSYTDKHWDDLIYVLGLNLMQIIKFVSLKL